MEKQALHFVLIDDDELTNQIHESIIGVWAENNVKVENATVKVFSDATAALDWLKNLDPESLPDLIFLDLNMPIMSGWDFLKEFQDSALSVPVCVLSSSIQKSDQERALTHPSVADYISKPLKPIVLDDLSSRMEDEED